MPIEMDILTFLKTLLSELPFFIPMVLFFSIVACIRSENHSQVIRYIKVAKFTGYIYAAVGIFSMTFGNAFALNIPSTLGIKYLTGSIFLSLFARASDEIYAIKREETKAATK